MSPRDAAIETYAAIERELQCEARHLREIGCPAFAMEIRRKAAFVHRATIAEIIDPEPRKVGRR